MILTDNEPKSLEMGYYPASDTYVLMRFECHEKIQKVNSEIYMWKKARNLTVFQNLFTSWN